MNLIQEEWFWTAVAAGVAAVSIPVSLVALRQSGKALRVNIPAPEVYWREDQYLTIKIRDEDEHHFGIAEIRSQDGTFRDAKIGERDPYGGFTVNPTGPSFKREKYKPLTSLVNVYAYFPGDSGIEVKIASRAEASVAAWIRCGR